MAFGNTYDTTSPGSGVGNREDLSDVVSIVEPEQTPVYSLMSKSTARATNPEWTLDKLKDPSTGASGVSEGADVTSFSDQHAGKAKAFNYTQKFQDTWQVSDFQNAVDSAGGGDATSVAGAKAKAMRNVKRFVEYAINSDNGRQAEDGSGTSPYLMSGLGDSINASNTDYAANYRTPSGSIGSSGASTTESGFNDILESIFRQSGEAEQLTVVASTALRQTISNFTRSQLGELGAAGSANSTIGRYTVNEDSTSKQITLAVNVFDSDFGFCNIINANPACEQANDRGYILNMKYLKLLSLVGMSSYELEDQGGGQRGYVKCIETIANLNPLAHGKIT
jgi:hypothetical protein